MFPYFPASRKAAFSSLKFKLNAKNCTVEIDRTVTVPLLFRWTLPAFDSGFPCRPHSAVKTGVVQTAFPILADVDVTFLEERNCAVVGNLHHAVGVTCYPISSHLSVEILR